MSDGMVSSAGVPEVIVGQTAPAAAGAVPTVSLDWANMAADMAAIEKEMQPAQPDQAGQPPAAATQTPQASAPATPAPVAAQQPTPEPDVPEQFRGADGKLDQEKLLKSYGDLRREFNRKLNSEKTPIPTQAAPQAPVIQPGVQTPQPQVPAFQPFTPFELQVAQDMIDTAAAVGQAMPKEYALAQARVQVRLLDAKHQADKAATFSKVEEFEQRLVEQDTRRELDLLARNNPWVLEPQGFEQIKAIMAEKPWMFANSPSPVADAVEVLLGRRARSNATTAGQPGQVPMPNPAGVQQIKPLPVTPAPAVPQPIQLNTQAEIEAYVKTLSPQQEAEFWKKSGLKWDSPRPFTGVF